MTNEEENAIVHASAEALMKQLSIGSKSVEAVVTVVLYKGGEDFHIGTMLELERPPSDEGEAGRAEGSALMTASELIEDYVHEQGLCDHCNHEKGTVQ